MYKAYNLHECLNLIQHYATIIYVSYIQIKPWSLPTSTPCVIGQYMHVHTYTYINACHYAYIHDKILCMHFTCVYIVTLPFH